MYLEFTSGIAPVTLALGLMRVPDRSLKTSVPLGAASRASAQRYTSQCILNAAFCKENPEYCSSKSLDCMRQTFPVPSHLLPMHNQGIGFLVMVGGLQTCEFLILCWGHCSCPKLESGRCPFLKLCSPSPFQHSQLSHSLMYIIKTLDLSPCCIIMLCLLFCSFFIQTELLGDRDHV